MVNKVQIFSERCSGSNFLQAFIVENFQGVEITWRHGWKHWIPKPGIDFHDDEVIILLVRSPFDWLRSIHRSPWHCSPELKGIQFSKFIRTEWCCVYDQDARIRRSNPIWMTEMMHERHHDGRRYKNILEMRDVKHRCWRNYIQASQNHLLIRYEDLLHNPAQVSHEISCVMSKAPPNHIILPKKYKGQFSWRRGIKKILTLGIKKNSVSHSKYALNSADIEHVCNYLDSNSEMMLGYDLRVLAENEMELGKA